MDPLGCDGVGDLLHVTGEHNGLLNARMLQVCNGLLGVRLDDIGDDDVAGVLAVERHVDYCADTVAALVGDVQLLHELVVAGGDLNSIYLGDNAVAADLFDIRDAAAVDLLAVGALETLADRMGGGTFGESCVLKQLFLLDRCVVHGADLEYALGQRAGLVKHNSLDLRQSLKIVGAFDEDTFLARAADAGEEAERDADDERAGAADNEEGQRTVYPLFPLCVKSGDETDYRRQHREGERTVTNVPANRKE